MSNNSVNVIKKPLVTEKGSLHLKENVYSFEVNPASSKEQIAKAVEQLFKVKVESVRTMNSRGRAKRVGRFLSKVGHYKKALVKLQDGHKIKIFEGV
jgi:large subunit ribosomal protein L23